MMMNLFSVFDPSVMMFQLNWISFLFVFMAIPISFYFIKSGLVFLVSNGFYSMGMSLKEIVNPHHMGMMLLGLGVFVFLMLNNVMGLFSFVFVSTAHPMFTMSMGLVYWVSFAVMGWVKTFSKSAGHLVPEGSPLLLAPVLVLIELISHLIRPFTLSIRLAANMMAGHLIMGLLSSISLVQGSSFVISVFMQMTLYLLEFAVALIQGLVFSILLLLYAVDYY
uniref:ATP synthase subunit a n=1 Tax=Harpactocrates apennicola TaxID=1110479 RepID=A0A516IMG8_9ARAC|nr:ATP synthase F0 subunit 6 [Harpactocrates apennicola]QDP17921.1 ATP synthase F0 subunit 6 [Harpactocrates apennicola]